LDQEEIRRARAGNWLIHQLQFSPEYRLSLTRYAESMRRLNPSLSRHCRRLLRAYPCLVGSAPHPETGSYTPPRSRRRRKIDE